MSKLDEILAGSLEELEQASNLEELDKIRVEYIGKNGRISLLMKDIGNLSPEERKNFGAEINNIKNIFNSKLEERGAHLQAKSLEDKLNSEFIDLSVPARPFNNGKIHPITRVTEELSSILGSMGFTVTDGPNIEDDWHNFTALNIPANHPARQMHDTFYLNAQDKEQEPLLLRTHTSPVQIRSMLAGKPPFRIMVPGRTYRCDWDMTHTPMFHQTEGLVVDKNINFSHMKSCIIEFIQRFFEIDDLPIRFRPSFFPFTEPSAEVDIGCNRENGEFKIGKGSSWLEIMGCGMIHPNVLKNVNIDPEEYQGFAFGLGIERMAMLKYGISDLRTFFSGDIRWLEHYGFSAFDVPNLLASMTR